MKILKNIDKKKIIKSFIFILISLLIFYGFIAIYSFIFEQDKMVIDKYNFEQLEKVKVILNKNPEKKVFYNFNDFNKIYESDIKPIKNCYYLSYSNGNKPYIFGFKLESLIYRIMYFGKNYAYPSYSIPIKELCFGKGISLGCHYTDKQPFIETISNPCR